MGQFTFSFYFNKISENRLIFCRKEKFHILHVSSKDGIIVKISIYASLFSVNLFKFSTPPPAPVAHLLDPVLVSSYAKRATDHSTVSKDGRS